LRNNYGPLFLNGIPFFSRETVYGPPLTGHPLFIDKIANKRGGAIKRGADPRFPGFFVGNF